MNQDSLSMLFQKLRNDWSCPLVLFEVQSAHCVMLSYEGWVSGVLYDHDVGSPAQLAHTSSRSDSSTAYEPGQCLTKHGQQDAVCICSNCLMGMYKKRLLLPSLHLAIFTSLDASGLAAINLRMHAKDSKAGF